MYSYLEQNNLLSQSQSGFRKGRSTKDILFFLTQKIKETLIRGKKVCSFAFDISKAFDSVWLNGIIFKMHILKIPSYLIQVTKDFIENRSFYVEVGNEKSETKLISNGVPQGSVLGPLLFLIFINDIPMLNNINVSYSMLYADDLTSFFIYKKPGKMKSIAKKYLGELEKWLFKWRFKLSVSKSCYTIFSKKPDKKTDLDFKINNQSIPYSSNPTLLGVTFDQCLCFNTHVKNIRDKCLNRLNLIKILSHKEWKLSPKTLITLYKTLIGSIIDYSSFIIHNLSQTNKKKIQAIQNRALRSIFKRPFDSSTSELCQLGKMSTVEERLVFLNKSFIARCVARGGWIAQLVDEFKRSRVIYKDASDCPLNHYVS